MSPSAVWVAVVQPSDHNPGDTRPQSDLASPFAAMGDNRPPESRAIILYVMGGRMSPSAVWVAVVQLSDHNLGDTRPQSDPASLFAAIGDNRPPELRATISYVTGGRMSPSAVWVAVVQPSDHNPGDTRL
jgi:hypothetical protein